MKEITTGSDFSGVGAFDYAMEDVAKEQEFIHKRVFACDWDKFARISYVSAHGEPAYFPKDVYEREIPAEPLDIYMTSPPCQDFSIAGKTPEESAKTVLFFNSLEFIQVNNPRYFIFENVKGLLSHNKSNKDEKIGKTFREWLNLLGGKSVNGEAVLFPYDNSVPYHIYWKVLNSKEHGVPQNRERVFIVGIRDDVDNSFTWPKEEHLTTKLKDVLEDEIDEKYFLSDKMVKGLLNKNQQDNGFTFKPKTGESIGNCVTARCFRMGTDDNYVKVGTLRTHKDGEGFREIKDGTCPTIPARAREDGSGQPVIMINSATKRGFEIAKEGDLVNYENPNSKTRKGRVGKQVSQTLNTGAMMGVCIQVLTPDRAEKRQNGRRFKEDGDPSFTLTAQDKHGVFDGMRIRRLTPLECFRLQDFPDAHVQKCKDVGMSDSQLYKQAGNSITRRVLKKIISKFKL